MDGWRDRIRSKVRGQDGAGVEVGGRGVVSQPICSSSLIPKRKGRGRGEEEEEERGARHHASHFISQ